MKNDNVTTKIISNEELARIDIDQAIFELDNKIDMLSPHADNIDYFIAISSGLICAIIDVFSVKEFDLRRGRNLATKQVNSVVIKIAKLQGCKKNDIKDCVKFLEKSFKLSSDRHINIYGGALQHHLRDFSHHLSICGLLFSILTQFTGYTFGTDTNGKFILNKLEDDSLVGKNFAEKICFGTIIWAFHLISDMAGSSATASLTGGTGIPGPILSIFKEMSSLPIFQSRDGNKFSLFISKLFNGTLFAEHDSNGKIIPNTKLQLDFRGELGVLNELGGQAFPVLINETIVRTFYFIRRLGVELKQQMPKRISDIKNIDWNKVKPFKNATVDRMMTVATSVFTTVDVTSAICMHRERWFIAVNYVGVGRFVVAIGKETINCINRNNVKKIKRMYETLRRNTLMINNYFSKIFNLSVEQLEILYNIEMHKTLNDINTTHNKIFNDKKRKLKEEWLDNWKSYIDKGFSYFVGDDKAKIHWYDKEELMNKIDSMNPKKDYWYKVVLLESMLFTPYFTILLNNNKPDKKYARLKDYDIVEADKFLEKLSFKYCSNGFIKKIRKTYTKVLNELNTSNKSIPKKIVNICLTSVLSYLALTAFAPQIAILLVGTKFIGLSGCALTNACLAYIGGGAIAAGGAGMAGGTVAIAGGGAALTSAGALTINKITDVNKMNLFENDIIYNSAKLITTIKEIIIGSNKDLQSAKEIYEQYRLNTIDFNNKLFECKLLENEAKGKKKKELTKELKFKEEIQKKSLCTLRLINDSL